MKSLFLELAVIFSLTICCSSECVQKLFAPEDIFSRPGFRFKRNPRLETTVCTNISADINLDVVYKPQSFRQELWIKDSLIPKLPANSSLSKFTKIKTLRLAGIGLEEIESGAFEGLVALEELTLNNNELTKISPGIFNNLVTLETLSLVDNNISEIENGSFSDLNALSTLYLIGNQLTTLQEDVFSGLELLEELWVSENPLTQFFSSDFPNLRTIIVDKTALKFLEVNFTGSPLKVAQFTDGQLEEIDFIKFPPLGLLQLGYNQISVVHNWETLECDRLFLNHNQLTTFDIPDSVLELRLSHNLITSFGNFTDENKKLKELDLSFNKIPEIELDTLRGLPELQYLNLANNEIVTLKGNNFAGSPRLRKLFLANNKIETIEANAFKGLKNLDELDISGNNLKTLKAPALSELKITNVIIGNTDIDWEYVKTLIANSEDLSLQLDQEFWSCKYLDDKTDNKIKYVTKHNIQRVLCQFKKSDSKV